jgi:hypothetical protein
LASALLRIDAEGLIMSAFESSLVDFAPHQLEAFVRDSGSSDGLDFLSLEVGTTVTVRTRYSTYRLVVVDPEQRRARVTGGQLFEEPTNVRLEGATAGGSAIKPGWIGIGLRLELTSDSNRVTTSVVQSLSVNRPLSSLVS